MDTLFLLNRGLHIAAGFVGFFVAPTALLVRKGGPAHRRWGRVFFWSMVVAGGTALLGALRIHSLFLLLTGIFSLYMALFGYRSLYLKFLSHESRVPAIDWLTAGLGLCVFAGTVAYGLRAGNPPAAIFGALGAMTALRQLLGFRRAGRWSRRQWLLNHISGFLASYMVAVSAFSATSLTFIPFPYNFLWPTALGVPLIMWWHRRVNSGQWAISSAQ